MVVIEEDVLYPTVQSVYVSVVKLDETMSTKISIFFFPILPLKMSLRQAGEWLGDS